MIDNMIYIYILKQELLVFSYERVRRPRPFTETQIGENLCIIIKSLKTALNLSVCPSGEPLMVLYMPNLTTKHFRYGSM